MLSADDFSLDTIHFRNGSGVVSSRAVKFLDIECHGTCPSVNLARSTFVLHLLTRCDVDHVMEQSRWLAGTHLSSCGFTHVHSPIPVCIHIPFRVKGLIPRSHRRYKPIRDFKFPNLADLLRRDGFRTFAWFGPLVLSTVPT